MRIAFLGFRHGHILSLYKAAKTHPNVQIVAASEDDPQTIDSIRSAGLVALTHTDHRKLLSEVDCDTIAIGDYFSRRCSLIIESLNANKHILSDKPLCTSLSELETIAKLAREKNRKIGCLFDLRDSGPFRLMRKLIQQDTIGEVQTIAFSAQHPLFLGTRAAWYFEPNKHGGTLNDIAVHATDLIPWLTGRQLKQVVSARAWNARLPQFPDFQDAAQCMLKLDNNGGVLGDVSYLSPDGLAYSAPQYWRLTIHGTDGLLEGSYSNRTVLLATRADKSPRILEAENDDPTGRLTDFLADLQNESREGALTTKDVLAASRQALLIQQSADQNHPGTNL